MFLDLKFEIPTQLAYSIIGLFFITILAISFILYLTKKKRSFIARLVYILIHNGMHKVNVVKEKMDYNLTFFCHKDKYYLKIIHGGKYKGIVATNPSTIYIQSFKDETSAAKSNEVLHSVTSFLVKKLDGQKVIIVYNNLLRANKYINENELETITYLKDTFNTRIVMEKDFVDYIKLLKESIKQKEGKK